MYSKIGEYCSRRVRMSTGKDLSLGIRKKNYGKRGLEVRNLGSNSEKQNAVLNSGVVLKTEDRSKKMRDQTMKL